MRIAHLPFGAVSSNACSVGDARCASVDA